MPELSKFNRLIPFVQIQPIPNETILYRNKRKTEAGVTFDVMGEIPRRIETALTNDPKFELRGRLMKAERTEKSIDQSTMKANNNTQEDKDSQMNDKTVSISSPGIRVTVSQLGLMRELA